MAAEEYAVTITFQFVTKENRRHIAELAWAIITTEEDQEQKP